MKHNLLNFSIATITITIIIIIIIIIIFVIIYYYYCYYYCLYLGLVSSSCIFPREQAAPSNLRSPGFALQFLQFQTMLLFEKALCYSLRLTSPASLSVFLMSLPGLQLQLE